MMGSVEPLVMVGEGDITRSLGVEIKYWNNFKLISGDAAGGAEAVHVSWCGEQRVGKVMLNLFIPHVRDPGGVDSMKILDRMEVPASFAIIMVMQPDRVLVSYEEQEF